MQPSSIDVTGATGLDFIYTWDANKNKLTEAINAPMDDYGFTATYDDEDRLLTWERDDGNLDQSWSLSAVGNWNSFTENTVTETRTHGDAHELTAIGGTSLTYDAKGNLTTNVNSHTYVWDMDNMLKSATVPSGSTEGIVGTHEYEYDALGRRVSKSVTDSATGTTTYWVYIYHFQGGMGQVLAEYEFTTGSPTLVRKYAYGDYIDEPLVLINVSGASETMYYYHRNQQCSVCGLTDSNASIVEFSSYGPFGRIGLSNISGSALAVSSVGNTTSYTGRTSFPELALYDFRTRVYNPHSGLFTSRDKIQYIGGLCLYQSLFAMQFTDPGGFRPNAGKIVQNWIRNKLKRRIDQYKAQYKDSCFYQAIGLDRFFDSLKSMLDKVRFDVIDRFDNTVSYNPINNNLDITSTDNGSGFSAIDAANGIPINELLHELTHVFDDHNDWYLSNFNTRLAGSLESAEALASSTEHFLIMLDVLQGLVDANADSENGAASCNSMKRNWNSFWNKVTDLPYSGPDVTWGVLETTRQLTSTDFVDFMDKFNIKISCKTILINCIEFTCPCDLQCPSDLPEYLE